MEDLKQELNEEQLNEVAGGKKLTQAALREAEKNLVEAETRAKELMNTNGGSFSIR